MCMVFQELLSFVKVESLLPEGEGSVQHRARTLARHYFGCLLHGTDAMASESRLFDGLTTGSLVDISSAYY